MKNIIPLFHSVVEFAHRICLKNPSRARKGAATEHPANEPPRDSLRDPLRQMIREEMREMLRELLSDPQSTARLLRPAVAGSTLPFAGGTSSANYIMKDNGSGSPVDTVAPIYEDSSGHVGIGTTSPAFTLQLQLSSSQVDGVALVAPEVNTYLHALLILSSRGPSTSPEVIQGGDYIWNFFGEGYDGSVYDLACAISMLVEGTVSSGIVPGVISFSTANASGTLLERMRINSAGYVGIGTTNPATILHVNGGTVTESGTAIVRSDATGDARHLMLNQTGDASASQAGWRTAVSFDYQGTENWVAGVDWNGGYGGVGGRPDFFMADGSGFKRVVMLKPMGGDINDDPQIQAAIDMFAAQSPSGGIIYLTQGTYLIANTLSIQNDGIKLRGCGGTWEGDASGGGPDVPSVTLLQWNSTENSAIIEMVSPDVDDFVQDLEISDLTINGNGYAQVGLYMSQVMTSKFINFHVKNLMPRSGECTGEAYSTGIEMTTEATGTADTVWNLFENCTVTGASIGISLDGQQLSEDQPTPTNCCHNTFIGLTIRSNGCNGADAGIWLGFCDNNTFYRTWIQMDSSTGYGVQIDNPTTASSNYFYHLQAGINGLHISNTSGTPTVPNKNFVFGYDQGNGEMDPSTDSSNPAKNYLAWIDSQGAASGIGSQLYPELSGALSASNFPAVNANEYGFVYDGTNFWLVYFDGANKWAWQGIKIT